MVAVLTPLGEQPAEVPVEEDSGSVLVEDTEEERSNERPHDDLDLLGGSLTSSGSGNAVQTPDGESDGGRGGEDEHLAEHVILAEGDGEGGSEESGHERQCHELRSQKEVSV